MSVGNDDSRPSSLTPPPQVGGSDKILGKPPPPVSPGKGLCGTSGVHHHCLLVP